MPIKKDSKLFKEKLSFKGKNNYNNRKRRCKFRILKGYKIMIRRGFD